MELELFKRHYEEFNEVCRKSDVFDTAAPSGTKVHRTIQAAGLDWPVTVTRYEPRSDGKGIRHPIWVVEHIGINDVNEYAACYTKPDDEGNSERLPL